MSSSPAATAIDGMTSESRVTYTLGFDPRLVENSVLVAIESASPEARRRFHREREPIYEIVDAATRESRFGSFYGNWFVQLGIAKPLHRVIEEYPSVSAGTSRALVVPIVKAREEFADLQGERRSSNRPVLLLRLRVTTLVSPGRLTPWLHHELVHIADMLDPRFGFERTLGSEHADSTMENVVRQRYRVLWDTTVDGRLQTRGVLPTGQKSLRRRDFLNTFRMLGEEGPAVFERFFQARRPTHADLAAFAAKPTPTADGEASGRCPLCTMPCARMQPRTAELASAVLESIRHDYPNWEPTQGLCLQCADLYSAKAIDLRPG